MSIILQEEFKEKAEKFFPIIAKDINEKVIEDNIKAQNTPKAIDKGFERAKNELGNNIEQYITPAKNLSDGYPTKKVINKVEFSCANILEDIENIDNKNPSIIMCRNMWPYIDDDEYQNFANKLYERLAPGSVVIIGNYDCEGEDGLPDTDKFPDALLNAGFEKPQPWLNSNTRNFNYYLIFEKNRPYSKF